MAKSILIIDDSASLRSVLKLSLESAGFSVEEAENGQLALDKLDGRRYNLIICDVNMPVLDGFGFVEAAKKITDYQYTPILMLTTDASPESKQRGKALGVRGWAVKPFTPPKLLAIINKLLPN
jgi:two-component system, chemotaxis family, chemotaxis protein CheY